MVQAIARNDAQARRLAGDLVAQWRVAIAWLKEVEAADHGRPSVLQHHTVRDVVGHLLFLATDLSQSLSQPTTTRPVSLAAHLRTLMHTASRMDELTRQTIGHESGPSLVRQLGVLVADLAHQLDGPLPQVVQTLYEPVRVVDLLRTSTVELVQHAHDLSSSLPEQAPLPLERGALFTAVRTLAEMLAELRPGRSVELRVPPAVAVQLASPDGEGPTHTRGTPPTVVETDPVTFLVLATGRLAWRDAVRDARVVASGAHADLSDYFPVSRP